MRTINFDSYYDAPPEELMYFEVCSNEKCSYMGDQFEHNEDRVKLSDCCPRCESFTKIIRDWV